MDYLIRNTDLRLDYQPESCALTITLGTHQWHWDSEPCIVLSDGTTLPFSCASCTSAPLKTGVTEGVAATYTNFHTDSVNYPFTLDTFVGLDAATGFLRVEFSLTGEQEGEIDAVLYPPQMRVEDPNGYTLLPRMQGSLLPRGSKLCIHRGIVYERDAYMPIYGQLEHGGGWLAIFDTPFDARYRFREDQVQPIFIPSLGKMRERRVMLFAFRAQCSYVELAKIYRGYLRERGMLVTLKEKIARNPNVAKMIGTPIIHTGIAVHIHPDSSFYDKEHPENNDTVVPFSQRAQELCALHEKVLRTHAFMLTVGASTDTMTVIRISSRFMLLLAAQKVFVRFSRLARSLDTFSAYTISIMTTITARNPTLRTAQSPILTAGIRSCRSGMVESRAYCAPRLRRNMSVATIMFLSSSVSKSTALISTFSPL